MTSVERACEKLREEGRRVTPQRRAIVRVLLEEDTHLTADQVLMRVRRQLPSISLATIYNTLHELVEVGLVQELDLGLGLEERSYDVAVGKHDHLVCISCGRVEDVTRRNGLGLRLGEDHNFTIIDRRVTYLGFCEDCASSSGAV